MNVTERDGFDIFVFDEFFRHNIYKFLGFNNKVHNERHPLNSTYWNLLER